MLLLFRIPAHIPAGKEDCIFHNIRDSSNLVGRRGGLAHLICGAPKDRRPIKSYVPDSSIGGLHACGSWRYGATSDTGPDA
jgi:hypothetical protein